MLSNMQVRLREECDVEDCRKLEISTDSIIYYGTFEDLCMMEMEIWG